MERQAKSFDNKSVGPRPGQSSGRPAGGGPPRGDRPRRDKGSQVERAEREQYYAKPHGTGGSDRNKAPDPNSPFAKLAALKQQLEQGNKP
jgi:ATP-dependent RNA helicase SUPV3L1/SUV3